MKKSRILLLSALFIGALAFISCGNAGDKAKEKECEKTECETVKADSTECEHATAEEAAAVETETDAIQESSKDEKQVENLPEKKAEPNEKEQIKR